MACCAGCCCAGCLLCRVPAAPGARRFASYPQAPELDYSMAAEILFLIETLERPGGGEG